jgi:hypothetical protein
MPIIGTPIETIPYVSGASNSYTIEKTLIYKDYFGAIELTGTFEIPSGESYTHVDIISSAVGFVFSEPEITEAGGYVFNVDYGEFQSSATITVTAPWGDSQVFNLVVGTPSFLSLIKQVFLNPTIKESDYGIVAQLVSGAMRFVEGNTNIKFPDTFPSVLFGGFMPVTDISAYTSGIISFNYAGKGTQQIELDVSGKNTMAKICTELQAKLRAVEDGTGMYESIIVGNDGVRYIINTGLILDNAGIVFECLTSDPNIARALKLCPQTGAIMHKTKISGDRDGELLYAAYRIALAMYGVVGNEGFSSVSVGEMSYSVVVENDRYIKSLLGNNRRFAL